jgi:hypothetical protein
MLKAACRATMQPIPYSLDEPSQGSMAVQVTTGTTTYCTRFGGVVTDSGATGKFLAKDAAPPSTCPVPPVACP